MLKGKTIWINGASSGIGKALAVECAKKGADLIISSRKKDALDDVKKICEKNSVKVKVVMLDLESPSSIDVATAEVLESVNVIDYVFLNGGLSQRSYIVDSPIDIDRKMMEINYFGNIYLAKKILPFFINQGHGHFTVTTSLTGVFGIPLRSSYAASKHALHGFFDTLRAEQKANNINVTIVCPGFIQTDISKNALDGKGNPTGKMDEAQSNGMSTQKCAKKMISATLNRKKEVYIGGKELLMVYFKKYLPFLYYFLASRVKPN